MLTVDERRTLIHKIRLLPEELAKAIDGLTFEQLNTPYGEGKWTVRQVVNHVADSHVNGFARMKLVVTEENPDLKPYDQDRWAQLEDTINHPPAAALRTLSGLHERWVAFLESLPNEAWARKGNHLEAGEMTLDQLLVDYANHGEKHIGHVMGLREAKGW